MPTRNAETIDARLCRYILEALVVAFTQGDGRPLPGSILIDYANEPGGHEFDGDDHFLRLCRELKLKGLVSELPGETRRRGEGVALRHSKWEITPKGAQLVNEEIPPIKGVWDERIGGDE